MCKLKHFYMQNEDTTCRLIAKTKRKKKYDFKINAIIFYFIANFTRDLLNKKGKG